MDENKCIMKVNRISLSTRARIYKTLKNKLSSRDEIVFVYIHGSFNTGIFRDIDIAVYVNRFLDKKQVLDYELSLERELENTVNFPVDVRILNYSPLTFNFNVIKNGKLLFSKDEKIRVDFVSLTITKFHDFKFHLDEYRRTAIGLEI
ncbi:MAG: nucleotidyltransferase domain-containing protein [Candidatus Odinarchaeia archaeon]